VCWVAAPAIRRLPPAFDPPPAPVEHPHDVGPFGVTQRVWHGTPARLANLPRGTERFVDLQHCAGREDQGPIDHVLQFADVAWPVVGHEGVHRGNRYLLDDSPERALAPLDEVPDQQRDIVAALAQRWDLDWNTPSRW